MDGIVVKNEMLEDDEIPFVKELHSQADTTENNEDIIENEIHLNSMTHIPIVKMEVEINNYNSANKHTCEFCKEHFSSTIDLNNHISQHLDFLSTNSERVTYSCDECGRKFINKSYVKEHKLKMHSELRPFSCVCASSFKTRRRLMIHKRRSKKLKCKNLLL